MARFVVSVEHPLDNIKHETKSYKQRLGLVRLSEAFAQMAAHIKRATRVEVRRGAVKASGAVTCASVSAADTVTVAGVVFTAVAGAAGANQFSIDGNDTA